MKRTTVSERALVLAPRGRDAAIAAAMLGEAGLEAHACGSLGDLLGELDMGAAFVVVTEEALASSDLAPLARWIGEQEEWSDLPFVLLTSRGGGLERNPAAGRYLDLLGNVTFLERPFHPTTLVSLARSALRGRRRQYDARARLAELREGEERYRTLFETMDEGFCVIEFLDGPNGPLSDYVHVEANRAFERHTGISEPVGRRVRDLVGDEAGVWVERYRRVLVTGEPIRFESELLATGRHLELAAFRIEPASRREVAVIFQDVTERQRAQDQLRTLNETLEGLVAERSAELDRTWRLSQDLFGIADARGCFFRTNPAWQRVLGWSAEELATTRFLTLIHPEDRDRTEAAMAGLDEGRPAFLFENRYRTRAGDYRWLSWSATPEQGLWYCVARDVTTDKLRVAELEAAQQALKQSQKMEAMGQLTGGVAHDFNNLLTPIVGSLDLLKRRGLGGAREQRLIEGAMQSAERAKVLVQRLLAFARRQPLQAVPVDIAQLIDGMADLIASTTGPQIGIAIDAPAGLPAAEIDPNQLEMALLNLAVNARDAMPDGGALRIAADAREVARAEPDLRPGRYVRLTVSDTGVGMDAATRARAIEPFYSTKGVGKGTGLGLSMAHGLASQLGGALRIDSAPGRGTTIELWLPQATLAAAPVTRGEVGTMTPVVRGAALLVDDEELVRASTADMLADLGFHVTEAASAERALDLLREGRRYDLVVTDHLMPGMTGAELAGQVRTLYPDTRVLLISGYAENVGVESGLSRLTKPFRADELAASLGQLH